MKPLSMYLAINTFALLLESGFILMFNPAPDGCFPFALGFPTSSSSPYGFEAGISVLFIRLFLFWVNNFLVLFLASSTIALQSSQILRRHPFSR